MLIHSKTCNEDHGEVRFQAGPKQRIGKKCLLNGLNGPQSRNFFWRAYQTSGLRDSSIAKQLLQSRPDEINTHVCGVFAKKTHLIYKGLTAKHDVKLIGHNFACFPQQKKKKVIHDRIHIANSRNMLGGVLPITVQLTKSLKCDQEMDEDSW